MTELIQLNLYNLGGSGNNEIFKICEFKIYKMSI